MALDDLAVSKCVGTSIMATPASVHSNTHMLCYASSARRPQFVGSEFSSGNRAVEIQLLEFTGVEFVGWNSPVAILQGLPVGIHMCWNSRAARDASAIGVLKK